jgi:2'-5' RNA ligase
MLHLGNDLPIEEVAEMIPVAYAVAAKTKPFTVSTSRVTTFPHGPDGTPIICPVMSNELVALRKELADAFDAAGIEYSKKWPVFKPHMTLGYASDPLVDADKVIDLDFPPITWGAHEFVLWGGDSGDNRVIVNFPLSVAATKEAFHRAFVRLANNWRSRLTRTP